MRTLKFKQPDGNVSIVEVKTKSQGVEIVKISGSSKSKTNEFLERMELGSKKLVRQRSLRQKVYASSTKIRVHSKKTR